MVLVLLFATSLLELRCHFPHQISGHEPCIGIASKCIDRGMDAVDGTLVRPLRRLALIDGWMPWTGRSCARIVASTAPAARMLGDVVASGPLFGGVARAAGAGAARAIAMRMHRDGNAVLVWMRNSNGDAKCRGNSFCGGRQNCRHRCDQSAKSCGCAISRISGPQASVDVEEGDGWKATADALRTATRTASLGTSYGCVVPQRTVGTSGMNRVRRGLMHISGVCILGNR